jgi:hypothetical protein
MKVFLKIFIASFLFLPVFVFAQKEIAINEIAWMGQKDSYSKEWIELYNPNDKAISLSGWKIKISKTEINLKGLIAAKSYYLMEHNNDNTVLNEKADFIFKKALNNKGEILILSDNSGKEVDRIDCSQGWFAGDNKTKHTMERKDYMADGSEKTNWQTSENENGTPKSENSKGLVSNNKKDENKTSVTTDSTGTSDNSRINKDDSYSPVSAETYFVASIVALLSASSVLAIKKLSA